MTAQHAPAGRIEDGRFLRGQGRFVDDIALPGMLQTVVLRSDQAHGRVTRLDVAAARALPGVRLVLTAADLHAEGVGPVLPLDFPPPGQELEALARYQQPLLAETHVRYVGEALAFVVAETLAQAQDGADAVEVEIDGLPAVIGLPADPDAGDVLFRFDLGDATAVARAFAAAAQVVPFDLHSQRVHAMPLEPRGAIGLHDAAADAFTLHVSTQRVHVLQRALADHVFRVPRSRMRVVAPDTGGGFGQKNGLYPEYALCLVAARRLGIPVKWISSRSEGLAADNHGRANRFVGSAALDAEGRIMALRVERMLDMGAYLAPRSSVMADNGLSHLTGVYDIPALHVTVTGLRSNTAPTSPYRGAGRPENVFCCERMIEIVARRLGHDPVGLRLAHLIDRQEATPVSALGTDFTGLDVGGTLGAALARAGHAGFPARRSDAAARGRLAGFGIALFAEDLHGSHEPVAVRIAWTGGGVRVVVGTGSAGHGHETVFLRMVAEKLGLPLERLEFMQSDTAALPDGIGTAASWSATLGGSSVHLAAAAAITRGRDVAARLWGADAATVTFEAGLFRSTDTNRSADWDEIFAADPGFAVEGVFRGTGQTVSIGCHVCEVEVDPDTGAVALTRALVVQDCGRVLDSAIVQGQLQGGFAQGVGQAWCEAVRYDSTSGQLLSGTLSDYALSRAGDLPQIDTLARAAGGTTDNPLGVKGIGESAATGATPAFVNAVLDALAPLGISDLAPPLSPATVQRAIAGATP